MIAGACGGQIPSWKVLRIQPAGAGITLLPPLAPQMAQVATCGIGGVLDADFFEEAAHAKKHGFTLQSPTGEQITNREALGEDDERLLVVPVAECLGQRLENGLFAALSLHEAVKASYAVRLVEEHCDFSGLFARLGLPVATP